MIADNTFYIIAAMLIVETIVTLALVGLGIAYMGQRMKLIERNHNALIACYGEITKKLNNG